MVSDCVLQETRRRPLQLPLQTPRGALYIYSKWPERHSLRQGLYHLERRTINPPSSPTSPSLGNPHLYVRLIRPHTSLSTSQNQTRRDQSTIEPRLDQGRTALDSSAPSKDPPPIPLRRIPSPRNEASHSIRSSQLFLRPTLLITLVLPTEM